MISIAFFFFDFFFLWDAYICHCIRLKYSHIALHNVLLNIKWTNKICYERDQQVHLIVANNNPNPFAISSISEKFLSMLSRFRLYYRLVTVCILFSFVNGNTQRMRFVLFEFWSFPLPSTAHRQAHTHTHTYVLRDYDIPTRSREPKIFWFLRLKNMLSCRNCIYTHINLGDWSRKRKEKGKPEAKKKKQKRIWRRSRKKTVRVFLLLTFSFIFDQP